MSGEGQSVDPLLLRAVDFLPAGITATPVPYGKRLGYRLYDAVTGMAADASVVLDDFLEEWEPPPPLPWWRKLEPLGYALDMADRRAREAKMRGRLVMDWDAVGLAGRERAEAAVSALLAARQT